MSLSKLEKRVSSTKSCLCIGLDSDFTKIPDHFKSLKHPQFEFNKWIVEETHTYAAAYKPNIAFYEARGADGWIDLSLTMEYIESRHPDIFTIADAKRADIGSTNQGYVTAFFDVLGFDALTVHPYLGREALQPFLERQDKTCIVLCKTSNPGSGELQDLQVDGKPVWQIVAQKVATEWNGNNNCMVVVGATYPAALQEARATLGDMWMLVPGVGTQGGNMEEVLRNGTRKDGKGVLVNVSRDIIFSSNPGESAKNFSRGV